MDIQYLSEEHINFSDGVYRKLNLFMARIVVFLFAFLIQTWDKTIF